MTNFPYELGLFAVALLGLVTLVCVVQARRKKEKEYYLSAVSSFVMLLAFVFALLYQFILMLLLVVAAGVFSIVRLPKMLKVREWELTERLQETDFSARLRITHFLSDIWWLKLASGWGLRKTICLFCLVYVLISGGIGFILRTLYSFVTIEFVVFYAAGFSVLSTFMHYQLLKRALKRSARNG